MKDQEALEVFWKALAQAGIDVEACKEAEVDPVMACAMLGVAVEIEIQVDEVTEWKGIYHDPA